MIAEQIDKLVGILDEKANLAAQRIDALLSGNKRKANYIEEYIYPAIYQRIERQIIKVSEEFMKYENRKETAKAN